MSENRKPDATDRAKLQAIAQMESVFAMVAALECDYDELEDLRNLKEDHEPDAPKSWDETYPAMAEKLDELEEAANGCTDREEAEQAIQEDPLSVEIRSDWCSPGETMEAGEFRIVLCTGGPHVELVGDLDRGTPSRVRCLYKDWGDSGELYQFDHDAVLTYCSQFYFGE